MLDGHSAVAWQGNIFIWGGKDESPQTANRPAQSFYSATMYMMNCLDAINQNAHALPMHRVSMAGNASGSSSGGGSSLPRGRAYHTASLYGKHMFIIGGLMDESSAPQGGSGQQNESNNNVVIPVFDLESRTWAFRSTFGDVPCARCHHVAVVYGDTIMVHGGYPILPGGQQKELTAEEMASMQHAMFDVHELNITTLRWRRISTSQSPSLWGHTAVAFNKNVIVFGGVDVVENTETGAVAVWHQEKKLWRWADFQNLELKCAMHTAVLDGSRMLVFGGVSFKQQKKIRTLFEFNLEFGTWRELTPRGQPPDGRIGHAAVVFQQHMIVIGGAAEGDGGSDGGGLTSAAARFDRKVYVYSSQTNDWRTLSVVTGTETESAAEGSSGGMWKSGDGQQQKIHPQSAAWSINKSAGAGGAPDGDEWDNTANRVRETLTRAKAIQQLADTATHALSSQPSGGGSGSEPATPSGGSRQQHQQVDAQQSLQRLRQNADPSTPYEYGGASAQKQQHGASNDPDARRAIDHLKSENERLRAQLEEFRNLSLNQHHSNPYEVPIYNTSSGLLPQNESLSSPGRARGASRMEGNAALSELAPRLNINVAEPPRSVGTSGGVAQGYMSRTAVSALVNSSLRDQPASASLAANLRAAASMDPMSYLTQTPHVAAFQNATFGQASNMPGSFQAPRTYEQLFGRQGAQSYNNASNSNLGNLIGVPSSPGYQGGVPHMEGMPPVPNSLKPLLSILTGGTLPGTAVPASYYPPNYNGSGYVSPQPQASPSPHTAQMGTPYMAARSQQMAAQQGMDSSMARPGDNGPGRTSRSQSLSKLVSGQGSMLSLSMLK